MAGQGTAATWSSPGQTYTIAAGSPAGAYIEVSDMSYNNLAPSGNQLHLDGSTTPGNASGVYRSLGATYNTASNVYWFSVLLQLDNNTASSYAGVSLFGSTGEALFLGQTWQATTWGVQCYHSSPQTHSSTVSSLNSANGFLVMELNGNTHTGNLYVNPATLGGSAPVTPNATFSFADFSFDRFRIQAGAENLDVDELRFGTTYASVTPIPEPGSLLVLCSLVGAWALRRTRRRA